MSNPFKYAIGRPSVSASAGDFLVPSAITRAGAETDATNYAASNLIVERMSRTWRSSTVGADATIIFDFGSAVLPAALFIEGANVATVTVESAATAGGSAVYTQAFTLPQCNVTLRYTRTCEVTGAIAQRYWRIKIATATPTIPVSTAYFSLARVSFIGTLHAMVQNWGLPYDVRPSRNGSHFDAADGNLDSVDLSQLYAVLQLQNDFPRNLGDGIEAQLLAMSTASNRDRIFMYENNGDTSRAWLCARIGDMTVQRGPFPLLHADVVLREVL